MSKLYLLLQVVASCMYVQAHGIIGREVCVFSIGLGTNLCVRCVPFAEVAQDLEQSALRTNGEL